MHELPVLGQPLFVQCQVKSREPDSGAYNL